MSGSYVGSFGERMKDFPKSRKRAPVHRGWWRVQGTTNALSKKRQTRIGPWIYFEASGKGNAQNKARAAVRSGGYRIIEAVVAPPELKPAWPWGPDDVLTAGFFIEASL